jgi:hypothetical protein
MRTRMIKSLSSAETGMAAAAGDSFQVPGWAGKAPTGMHADVMKDDKLIQVCGIIVRTRLMSVTNCRS